MNKEDNKPKSSHIPPSVRLGDYNVLRITKSVDFGLYLDGGDEGEILLPKRYVTPEMAIGDNIEVFIYLDMDERLVATTEHPIAKVGECAFLECAWTNEYGAFLKWGLMKDLFCPFREQKERMERGKSYQVYIMEDEKTHRLMATAKVERYQPATHRRALDFTERLLRYLRENNGYCDLNDKSSPEAIAARFGISKKAYKQAVGDLYKRRLITVTDEGIRSCENEDSSL
jgi:predicted RNA-binding protein (virulence factor B family)